MNGVTEVVMMAMLAIRHMIVMRLLRMDMMTGCGRGCTMIRRGSWFQVPLHYVSQVCSRSPNGCCHVISVFFQVCSRSLDCCVHVIMLTCLPGVHLPPGLRCSFKHDNAFARSAVAPWMFPHTKTHNQINTQTMNSFIN